MKLLLSIIYLFSLNALAQNNEQWQKMIQSCLSDSTFKHNLLHDPDFECTDSLTYNIPSWPVDYYQDSNFHLTFNGKYLSEFNRQDSNACFPFQVYFYKKSKSKFVVSVVYNIFFSPSCENEEGHGKEHGCFEKKVISIRRKFKIKRNGDLKIRDTEYGKRIMRGTFL